MRALPHKETHLLGKIFSTLYLIILEKIALQVVMVGFYTLTRSQQLAIFLAGVGWGELDLEQNKNSAHAFFETLPKITRKAARGPMHYAVVLLVASIR